MRRGPASEVCLVTMPYVALERPSIALSLLQAVLQRAGIPTRVLYENLRHAEFLGLHEYRLIEDLRCEVLLGDWVFSDVAFPDRGEDRDAYLAGLFGPGSRTAFERAYGVRVDDALEILEEARARAGQFVESSLERVLELRPRIVGCTSTFQQHVASLALLRRIREADPEIVTLLGGANCETTMGRSTHRSFPWVDFVVSGEGDAVIGDLCRALLGNGRDLPAEDLPYGVFGPEHRLHGYPPSELGDGLPRAVTRDLSDLPSPSYDDYFETLEASPHAGKIFPSLPIETSRGCWWGERAHCTFCGLNGSGMAYRSRPAAAVLRELAELSERYGYKNFEVVDNILDMRFFDTVLATLAEEQNGYRIFYEIKANLKRHQVALMRDAGITWVQPGIESLSTEVLRLMNKGSTATTNLQLLKWCRQQGIYVSWNILYGFPGEELGWYEPLLDWLPLVTHLQPPSVAQPIRFDRYSPYHAEPEKYGLALTPNQHYAQVYPLPGEELADLAYFFDGSGAPAYRRLRGAEMPGVLVRLGELIEAWQKAFYSGLPPLLCIEATDEGATVLDYRACATATRHDLTGLAQRVYEICDEAPSFAGLMRRLRADGHADPRESAVRRVVDDLRERRLLVDLDQRLVALAVRGDIPSLPETTEFPGGYVASSAAEMMASRRRRHEAKGALA